MAGEHGTSGGHDVLYYRQQNGLLPFGMCREVHCSGPHVLPQQAGEAAVDVGRGKGAREHPQNDTGRRHHAF